MMRPVESERDELLNKLTELRVMVPGAFQMEVTELRDLVQWQTERRAEDVRKSLWRPAHRPKKHSREVVVQALREYYHDVIIPRREGRKHHYLGVSIEA